MNTGFLWEPFFAEFSDYIETIVLSKEQLLIVGYFNIHVDVIDDYAWIILEGCWTCLSHLVSSSTQLMLATPMEISWTPLLLVSQIK